MQLLKGKVKDICVLFIFIAMLILGTKLDFRISDNLFSRHNWFNFFMEIIVKMPVYFIGLYACIGLFNLAKTKQKPMSYIFMAIYSLGGSICGMLMLEDVVASFNADGILKYAIAFIMAVVLFIVIYKYVPRNIDEDVNAKKEYLVAIISIAIVVALIFILKQLVERARFEDFLNATGNFSKWYQKGSGGDSFPSGHMASMVLLFACVPMLKKINFIKYKDYIIYIIAMALSLLTAYSRISHGKHYMSDVAVSGIIAFLVSKIVTWVILGINENNFEIKKDSLIDKL